MKNRSVIFVLVIVLVFSLGGCWHPLFDLEVSVGEQLTQRLSHVRSFSGGIKQPNEDDLEAKLVFIPFRIPLPTSGMMVLLNTEKKYLRYYSVAYDDVLDELDLISDYSDGYTNDSRLLGFGADVSGISFYTRTQIGYVEGIVAQSASGISYASIVLPAAGVRFASGINPNDSSLDMLSVADWENVSGTLSIRGEPFSDGSSVNSFGAPVSTGYDVGTYGIPKKGFIGRYPGNGDFVGSFIMEDGSIRNLRWTSNVNDAVGAPTEFVGLDVLLTGVLSDSQLFSQIDGTMTVYSSLGFYQYTIELGNVVFIQERFDTANAEWISVFTRTYVLNNEIYFDVFEIPTANLEDLATRH